MSTTKQFVYPGYMNEEAKEFFKEKSFDEEHPNVPVVGTFVILKDGSTHLIFRGETFEKDAEGNISLIK